MFGYRDPPCQGKPTFAKGRVQINAWACMGRLLRHDGPRVTARGPFAVIRYTRGMFESPGYAYRERRDEATARAIDAIADALKLIAMGRYGSAREPLSSARDHLERAAGEDECLVLAERAADE